MQEMAEEEERQRKRDEMDGALIYNNRVDVRGHKYVFGPTQI